MSKKKTLLIAVCAALMMIGAATMAYFTDQESATNTFTVGKVDITLMEYQVEEQNGQEVISASTDKGFPYKLIPGTTYSKMPIVTVTENSDPCWLFVTVDNQLKNVNGKNIEGTPTIEKQLADCFWTKIGTYTIDGKSLDVYAKNEIATPNIGYKLFDTFTVSGDAATNADIENAKTKVIDIKAYAVQAAGFDTAKAAWDATFGK